MASWLRVLDFAFCNAKIAKSIIDPLFGRFYWTFRRLVHKEPCLRQKGVADKKDCRLLYFGLLRLDDVQSDQDQIGGLKEWFLFAGELPG